MTLSPTLARSVAHFVCKTAVRGRLDLAGRPRLPSVMAPGCCRSLRLRLYGFEFVGMGHFWLVDCVDCVERCYIQTFPFLFPSFMPLAPFALLPSVTAIACIVLHFAHDLVSKCFHDADD